MPSIGGGTKLIRTLLAGDGEGVCAGVTDGVGADCSGEVEEEAGTPDVGAGLGVGDSCAAVIATKAKQETAATISKRRRAIRELSIVAPVHVRKNVILPFAVAQKFFIESICDKLIVQTIEAGKVMDCALGRVFARSPGFH